MLVLSALLFSVLVVPNVGYRTTNSSDTMVVYWGQNYAPDWMEKNLAYYCNLGYYDVIVISFLMAFNHTQQPNCGVPNGPVLNVANHGDDCGTFPNCPFILNCSATIGVDIETCQAKGVKIMLSINALGPSTDSEAQSFAITIWNMFLAGTNSAGIRPFGDVILDGIDLELYPRNDDAYSTFVIQLRDLMDNDKSKEYIISGAPQCIYPDQYLGPGPDKPLTVATSAFTWINVQFYNNYCGISNTDQFIISYTKWDAAANSGGYKTNVGILAAPAQGNGYVSPSTACGYVPQLRNYTSFNGFMIFEASFDTSDNLLMSSSLRNCLG